MALSFPDIDPVALTLGPLEIRWYALAYLAGFVLGWRYALYLAGRYEQGGVDKNAVDDFFPWAILGVILGGRIGYALFYQFEFYLAEPLEILKVWRGGMSFHGGLLGAVAAMAVFAYYRKISLLRLTDLVCCAAPIGLFFGRIANFINGELFGRVTGAPWGVVFPAGGPAPRHPSQLYEALLEGLVLFAVLAVMARRDKIAARPGILSGVFLVGYGAARGFVELFREPDSQLGYIADLFTMGQILSVPMMICGFVLIAYALRRDQNARAVNGT